MIKIRNYVVFHEYINKNFVNHLKACEMDSVEWNKERVIKKKERKRLENASDKWQLFSTGQQSVI